MSSLGKRSKKQAEPVNQVNYILVDFETRSMTDLRKVGAQNYIRCPTTEIMSAVWKKGDQVIVWCPALSGDSERDARWRDELDAKMGLKLCYNKLDNPPSQLLEWAQYPWMAHNADGFDKVLWDEYCKRLVSDTGMAVNRVNKFKPPSWIDTIHLARMADLPASLGKLLPTLLPDAKKDNPTAMLFLTKGQAIAGTLKGQVSRQNCFFRQGNVETWFKMLKYNILDVVHLDKIFTELCSMIDGSYELAVNSINKHREINEYGLLVDTEWINNLVAHWEMLGQSSTEEAAKMTGTPINLKSTQQVLAMLQKLGLHLPGNSLNKTTVDKILEDPSKFVDENDTQVMMAIELLALRQNVAKATIGKIARIARLVYGLSAAEAIIRNWAVLFGAHTGRYTSVGIQLHNLPRGTGATKKLSKWPMKELKSRDRALTAELLTELTRGSFIPRPGNDFGVYDFEAIEAKVCAWLVNCTEMLELHRNRKDPYISFAAKIYGVPESEVTKEQRFVGKQGILACQYQVGADKLEIMCEAFGVNLVNVGVTAKQVVEAFRKTYPEYPKFWKEINDATIRVVGGQERECYVGGPTGNAIRIYTHREGLMYQLPSGRKIRYNDPRISLKPAPWNERQMVSGVEYKHPRYGSKSLYGGLETENGVQAISYDIFQQKMNNSKLKIPLHAHDEIVAEVPKVGKLTGLTQFKQFGKAMSEDVEWAPGLPIGVEGFITDRYCKEPLKGTVKYHFLRGKEV